MRKIWVLAIAAALSGYQQGAPAAAAQDARPLIVCFGDSLTAGYGLEPGQSFPDLLQHDLDARGYGYRVENLGVSGETTEDGLARLSMVLAQRPAIVVLEFGANDGLRGQPVAHIQANLAQMIEVLQKAGSQVLLAGITLPPNYGAEYLRRFEAVYRALAARYKVPLIPFLLANVAGNPDLMQRDGLHPNATGERIVASTVWRAVEPMLKR